MDIIGYSLPLDYVKEILSTPFSILWQTEDCFSWKNNANGTFSAASAYKLLTQRPFEENENWKWIWKIPTNPKICMFIWLLAHGRVKSLNYLHNLGIIEDPMCKICNAQIESIDHIFCKCPAAIYVLNIIFLGSDLSPNNSSFKQWLRSLSCNMTLSPFFNIPWAVIFCFVIWGLWIQHNQFIYRHQNIDAQNTSNIIMDRVIEFWSSNPLSCSTTRKQIRLISWEPPPTGWIKLNTNGSVISNPGTTSCGGLFWDSQGQWVVGFTRRIGYTTALAAELWVIRDGLMIAVQHHIQNIIIEIDCKVAFLLITGEPNLHHPHSNLLRDCRGLLNMIP
ncbi:hypothetical protein SLA2020_096110 [Shorea laevis]